MTLRVPYWLSGVLGLNAYLATGSGTETLRSSACVFAPRPRTGEALAEPRSSGLVTLLPFVFFFAKCAALITSYVALPELRLVT